MNKHYEREMTAWERMLNMSPYSIVSMVARINGDVSKQMLKDAVIKIRERHTLLQVKITYKEDNTPWFTSQDVAPIPIEVIPRKDNETWIRLFEKECKKPFDFEKQTPIRFFLIHSESKSDLLIFCHHVICDGMSLAYLARDLMEHLGSPDLDVEVLPPLEPMNRNTIPEDQKLKGFISKVLNKINRKWESEKTDFDREDYLNLHKLYWENFNHKTISIELTEKETNVLVQACKREGVSVNSAITAAFVGGQVMVQGSNPDLSKIGIGGDLRGRLRPGVNEGMGFYAGMVNAKFTYNPKKSFWINAQKLHRMVGRLYNNKNFFKDPLMFSQLAPSIMESRNYKIVGKLITPEYSRFEKISSFSKRDDTLSKLLKRSKAESIESMVMGTAITNLTKMDFPAAYGDLELERLIMQPGGAFPLATVNLVVGVVTCSNRMSLIVEYAEERIGTDIVGEINKQALELLLQ